MIKYLFFLVIGLGISITPAFAVISSDNNPSEDLYIDESDNDGVCETTAAAGSYGKQQGTNTLYFGVAPAAGATDCYRNAIQWSLTGIPDQATVTDVDIIFEITAVAAGPRNCDVYNIENNLTSATAKVIFVDAGNGTNFISNDAACTTTGNNKTFDLGAGADAIVQAQLTTTNLFGVGFKSNNEVQDATDRTSQIDAEEDAGSTPKPTLVITYTIAMGKVSDLTATDVRALAVDLDWSTPAGSVSPDGYEINYTTPWSSNVATVNVADTNSLTTSATVSGLTGSTQYSFRVGSRLGSFINGSGNVLNITTDVDYTAAFTPGTFTTNFTGTDIRQIFFDRTDISSTSLRLNVTATNTINLACNFYYEFAQTNDTYTNIANTSISSTRDRASFLFNGVDNEVIDVHCWDQYDNSTESRYVITQTNFPFLQVIDNFRNGTYGTHGMFGAIDFVTMIAVIVSMIGFNRVNETVGMIFGLITLGAMSVLSNGSIISWASTFTVGFAVLIMWAISTTRKD